MLTAIYFVAIVLVICIIIYVLLQALTFLGINIPPAIRNIAAALIFLVLLYVFLRYFNLLPPGLTLVQSLVM